MARVRATCNRCGDTELAIDAVSVRICREDHDGVYTFTCPECGLSHEKEASRRTLDLLVASGAEVVFWSVPVEMMVQSGLGPLTHDHLLDFHEHLQDDGVIASALGALVDDRSRPTPPRSTSGTAGRIADMLNVGGAELLIILLVALIFLGPARLPEVARQIGQTLSTMRGLARGFQAELEAAARPDSLSPAPSKGQDDGEPGRLAARARAMGRTDDSDIRPVSAGGPGDLGPGTEPASDEEE